MQKIDPKAVVELAEHIKPNLEGEMKFDSVTKALYSTDASIYQIEPSGVITPKSKKMFAWLSRLLINLIYRFYLEGEELV